MLNVRRRNRVLMVHQHRCCRSRSTRSSANKVIEVMLNGVRLMRATTASRAQAPAATACSCAARDRHAHGLAIGGGVPRRKRRGSEEALPPSTAQVQQVTLLMQRARPSPSFSPNYERRSRSTGWLAAAAREGRHARKRRGGCGGERRRRHAHALCRRRAHGGCGSSSIPGTVSPGVLLRAPLVPSELCGELPESKQFSDLKPPPVGYGHAFSIPANRLALELLDDDELALYEGCAGMAQRTGATTLPSASVVEGDARHSGCPCSL